MSEFHSSPVFYFFNWLYFSENNFLCVCYSLCKSFVYTAVGQDTL